MPREFIKDLARRNSPLLRSIVDFNLSTPLPDTLDQNLPMVPPALLDMVRASARGGRKLARGLCHPVEGNGFFYDFRHKPLRLALLDSEALQRVVFYCGLTLNSLFIRELISKSDVRAVRQSLGDEAYGYTVKSAPLFIGAEQPFPGIGPASSRGMAEMYGTCEENGLELLDLCLDGAPLTVSSGLRRKLPLRLATHAQRNAAPSEEEKGRAWRLVSRIMQQEVPAQWAKIFC